MAENSKPDKPVPCPRCQSLNTKFCYFNNYNVKQPRHFCRECQRYWTAGGSLRNVPVGAGRRKNKSSYNCNGTKSSDSGHGTMYASPSCNISSGDLADQGLCISPVASGTILSFKQPNAGPSNVSPTQTFAGFQDPSHTDVTGRNFSGFSEKEKNFNQSVSLELKLSKEKPEEKVEHEAAAPPSVNEELKAPSLVAKHDVVASHHMAERDESTCCSSVTATLACSSSEAVSQPATSTVMMPSLPFMNNSAGFSNPASWGPLMWPWLWPFIFSGTGTMLAPAGMPQVDPTALAVAFNSMPQVDPSLALRIGNLTGSNSIPHVDAVSMAESNVAASSGSSPHIDPALLAQLGALASGTIPQHIDPTLSAAVTASFLQWQRAWNPYSWGLPWNLQWNATANATPNLTNMLKKRPQSPTQSEEQKSLHVPKTLRTEPLEGGTVNSNTVTFQPLVNGFQSKTVVIQKPEEDNEVKGPSVAFQEHC